MQIDPTPNGPRFLGKYEVLARLDSGGMAEIFLARARALAGFEKLVVLKRILPHLAAEEEFVSMFLDEAKTTVALSHGNIVQVFDMGRGEDGDYFIAMEYVAGKNLRRMLRRCVEKEGAPLDPMLAAWMASEILRGLDYAHRRTDSAGKPLGIVHRDLSPHNILISYEGEVKVADFGIAKAAGKVVHTETGLIRGKANYMSPEQARAEPLDGRSDLFSVGTLLYELLTGVCPFDGPSSDVILRNLLDGPPPRPSEKRKEVPAGLDPILARALAQRREDRYQSADEFLKELHSFLAGSGAVIGQRDLATKLTTLFADELAQERQQMAALPKAAIPPPSNATPPLPGTNSNQPSGSSGATRLPTREVETPPDLLPFWRRAPAWAQAGAVLAIAAFLAVGGWFVVGGGTLSATPTPTAIAPATTAPPTQTPALAASPSPVTSALAAVSPRVTPTARPHASASPARTAVAIATPAAPSSGHLSVTAFPWAYVYLDGKPVRIDDPARPPDLVNGEKVSATPIQNLETRAGKHHLRVEQWNLETKTRLIEGESDVEIPANGEATVQFRAEGNRFVRAN